MRCNAPVSCLPLTGDLQGSDSKYQSTGISKIHMFATG